MKTVNLLFVLIYAFIGVNCSAQQNLIYNGDFEEYSDCPVFYSQAGPNPDIEKCVGWRAPTPGTSDYYNECSNDMSVPNNLQAYQYAFSGVAYLGILANDMDQPGGNYLYREYIQGLLIEPLIAGETYELSFDINLSNEYQVSLNELGAYFSDDAIGSPSSGPLNVIPQCSFTNPNFYSDTANWMHVESIFESTGEEEFVTIGCFTNPLTIEYYHYFNTDSSTTLLSYYFIDNVQLVRMYNNPPLPNIFTPNNDGVNDIWKSKECIYCEEKLDIVIQNRWGDIITKGRLDDFEWDGTDYVGQFCTEGTYFYKLSNGETGFIQLVR